MDKVAPPPLEGGRDALSAYSVPQEGERAKKGEEGRWRTRTTHGSIESAAQP